MNIVVLSFKIVQNRWKSLYCRGFHLKTQQLRGMLFLCVLFVEISEHQCTDVQHDSNTSNMVSLSCLFHCKLMNIVALSCIFLVIQNWWKLLYYHDSKFDIDENRCTLVFFHQTSMNVVVPSCMFIGNPWKSLYFHSKSLNIDGAIRSASLRSNIRRDPLSGAKLASKIDSKSKKNEQNIQWENNTIWPGLGRGGSKLIPKADASID